METIDIMTKNLFNKTIKKLANKHIIFFGEIHGTHEIPLMLSRYFEMLVRYYDFDIALEIPHNYQNEINEFINSGDEKILKNTPFFKNIKNSDGRNSYEYLQLIKKIGLLNKKYNKIIRVICIDVSEKENIKSQNNRERKISINILKNANKNKKIIVTMGNLHASKSVFQKKGKKILPVAHILFKEFGNKFFSINLKPISGSFYNFGIKKVSSKNKDDKKAFDETFIITKVTPCLFI